VAGGVLAGIAVLLLIPVGAILQLSGDDGDAGSAVWTATVFPAIALAIAGAASHRPRLGRAMIVLSALLLFGGGSVAFLIAWT
jgi:hypothetical protein